ncbi:hypothetical protein LG651_10395 [Tamlana sp. 62-3]|uniref:Glutamyl-tRNA reductase n=1 Tax=Neotamlana sargassicola TaxID=2883125 RepID=A0A9X1I739_9FLAO|nr:hypothetical protein [Tamlana sargassicola]MCB4808658.1 hypothetical protein [Tamlana sargassicola]
MMMRKLLYIGITHETSKASERAFYAFTSSEKERLITALRLKINVEGIAILSTCNRMELYVETSNGAPEIIKDVLVNFAQTLHNKALNKSLFTLHHTTAATVKYLATVASGLKSSIIGDKQIITQIRIAYKEAVAQNRQGTLLERAFQAVFKSHKRITKETLYFTGSTSTSYVTLKLVKDYFNANNIENGKVLLIGAGDMIQDILKYLKKIQFSNVYISNRTHIKAQEIAKKHQLNIVNWDDVENNNLEDFNAIISAVSNRKDIVCNTKLNQTKRIYLDLAVPFNVSDSLGVVNPIYNIEDISKEVNKVNGMQNNAIPFVKNIINQEVKSYTTWVSNYNNRRLKNDKPYKFIEAKKYLSAS